MGRQRALYGGDAHCCLLDLPVEVLEIVCEALKTDERVRLLSTCRGLYSLSRQHASFFHSVDLHLSSPRHARHARRWLRSKAVALRQLTLLEALPKPGYRRLPLDSTSDRGGVGGKGAGSSGSTAGKPWSVVAELIGAAPSLASLSWELRVPRLYNESAVELGDLQLPSLRSLTLGGNSDLLVILGGGFSRLHSLRTLSLGPSCSVEKRRGSLPRGLARLHLDAGEETWLDAPLRCTGKLRALRYAGQEAPAGLGRAAALTSLALTVDDGGLGVVQQLGTLTTLQHLALQGVFTESPAEWDALLTLTRLSVLVLTDCGDLQGCMARLQQLPALRRLVIDTATPLVCQSLRLLTQLEALELRVEMEERVPRHVWALEALRDLDVSQSFVRDPPPPPPPTQQLTRLALQLRQAVRLSLHLQQLEHLHALSLHGFPEIELSCQERRQLLSTLCALPRLRQLRLGKSLSEEVKGLLGEVPGWARTMEGREVEVVRLRERAWEV